MRRTTSTYCTTNPASIFIHVHTVLRSSCLASTRYAIAMYQHWSEIFRIQRTWVELLDVVIAQQWRTLMRRTKKHPRRSGSIFRHHSFKLFEELPRRNGLLVADHETVLNQRFHGCCLQMYETWRLNACEATYFHRSQASSTSVGLYRLCSVYCTLASQGRIQVWTWRTTVACFPLRSGPSAIRFRLSSWTVEKFPFCSKFINELNGDRIFCLRTA